MKKNEALKLLGAALLGSLITYLTCQFSYFEINWELDVPNLVLSLLSLVVGVWIAIELQGKMGKSQNNHSFLVQKLDIIWNEFDLWCQRIEIDGRVKRDDYTNFKLKIENPSEHLKSIFGALELEQDCIAQLSNRLSELNVWLENNTIQDNVIIIDNLADFRKEINETTTYFVTILKEIQQLS